MAKIMEKKVLPTHHCFLCMEPEFRSQSEFTKHLRDRHCTVEGGSFVCRYGYNGVCPSLPLDGVSDRDYESHVQKYHVNSATNKGAAEPKWSVFSAAQNLPAVLNDPSRGKQTNFFTKKWGDSFIERTSIPATPLLADIKWNHFDTYLKKIGKRYRRHERYAKMIRNEGESSPVSPPPRQLPHDGPTEGSLKDIPDIFMKSEVELWNPSTFVQVFPGIGGTDGVPTTNYTSGRLLQEKLSHYLDIVEVQIAKQVSQKSSAFFHAMTTQDTIMEQMRAAAVNVKKLRSRIRQLDETVVLNSLKIISCQRVQTNKCAVLEKLKLMATVHQTQPMIQLLLGTQDYVAALDLIATAQEILTQELSSIHCFRHLPSQLTEMEKLIDKMLSTDFERYSMADLNRPLSPDNEMDEQTVDDDKLISIVAGLLRQKNFTFIETYKDDVITTVRAVVKQMVIEVIANSDVELCLTGAGEEAQSLSLLEWIVLLTTATKTLLKLLKRVKLVHDLMQQTADLSAGKLGGGSENGDEREDGEREGDELNYTVDSDIFLLQADHALVTSKLSSLLDAVCNYCHERCANLVSNQSLEKSTPTIEQLVRLTNIVTAFTDGCEQICGVQCHALQSALKVQGTRFAQKFHAERKSKLALLLDSERWRQADVPAEFQKIIDNIAKDEFSWPKTPSSLPGTINNPTAPPSPVLIIDGQPYALVGAALILVQIVSEYCQCATQLPQISAQISRNVIDLLRTFNSRCCQLVLGAGALHLAGLKTITSTNLALVSRALQLVLWLLPHIKSHFRSFDINGNTTLSNGTAFSGYETVEKDFISHIKEVENKILMIVITLLTNQLDNWEAKPPVPSQSFRTISRHFVKLHEAIAPILPEQQVHSIYRTVNKNFKDKLREQLLKNNIANNGGPQHGVVISELTFYLETLRTLKTMPVAELNDNSMNDIWL